MPIYPIHESISIPSLTSSEIRNWSRSVFPFLALGRWLSWAMRKTNGSRIKIQAFFQPFRWYIVTEVFRVSKILALQIQPDLVRSLWGDKTSFVESTQSARTKRPSSSKYTKAGVCVAPLRFAHEFHDILIKLVCGVTLRKIDPTQILRSCQSSPGCFGTGTPFKLVFQDEKWMKGWSLVGPCWVCHTGQQAREALLLLCYFNLGNSMMLGCDNVMFNSNSSVHLRP